jgi:hypothetical protein
MDKNSADYFRLDALPSLSQGETIGIERGSLFRGKGNISPGADDTSVEAYGSGAPPEIDCSVLADHEAWSPVDNQSNIYRQEVDPPSFRGVANEAYPQAFEENREIPHRETVAEVENTPGSFNLDTSANPWVLYYHPTGSTDPRIDGKQLAYAYTPIGVNLAGPGIHNKSGVIKGLKVRRPLGGRGGVGPGVGGAVKKCLLYQGGKHHMIHPGGVIEDTVFAGSTINRGTLFSSAIAWFQGKHVTETYDAEVRRTVFRSMQANPSLSHDSNFSESVIRGGVFYDVPRAGHWPGETLTMEGGYLYNARNIPAIKKGTGHVYDGLMVDGLDDERGTGGGVMRKGFTMRNSVVLSQGLTNTVEAGQSFSFENCVLIGKTIRQKTDNTPSIRLKNCIIAALFSDVVGDGFSLDPRSDHCIFVTRSDVSETDLNGNRRSLRQLQNDTGAFANSAFLTVEQWRNFFEDWRRGDVRIRSDARVTHAEGTVSSTLPDGTPLTEVGPQRYWNGNTNQLEDGRPTQWPTPPLDEEDDETFVKGSWDWFQDPVDHENTVTLGDHLTAYWAMAGAPGDNEPDLIGQNDLEVLRGNTRSGRTDDFHYRRFDGENGYLETDPNDALENPLRFWMAFPIRLQSFKEEQSILVAMKTKGYRVKAVVKGALRFKLKHNAFTSFVNASITASTDQFQVVQMWSDPERALVGFRVGENEVVRDGAYGIGVNTGPKPFKLGADFSGDVGPWMIANAVPRQADRQWLGNDGRFRSLTEIRNHDMTMLDI